MIRRTPNALPAFLDARADWAFGYGLEPRTQDCVRFVSDGVREVTGHDALARIESSWTTAVGARRVLARLGGLKAAVDGVMRPISTTLARRGDVGMTADGCLVLIEGETVVGLHPERGQVRLARAALAWAWTVPDAAP